MSLKLANNAVSKLASPITTGSASIALSAGDGTKFPTLAAGEWFPVTVMDSSGTLEVMRCTARASDTLTVSRAQEGTAAAAFSAGALVELRLTAAAIAEIQSNVSTNTTTLGQLSGKNRIINGAGNVSQRAAFQQNGAFPGVSYGGPDRFFLYTVGTPGGTFTQSQGTITYGGIARNAVVQTVNSALTSLSSGNTWGGFIQAIEGFNCFDMLGSPAAISFVFNSNVIGAYAVAVRDYTGNHSFVATFNYAVANTPQRVVIQIPTIPTTLTTPNSPAGGMYVSIGALNTGTYQAGTLGAWLTGNYFSAPGAVNWGASAGNFIAITMLQFEAGLVATPFDVRPFGVELMLCQRYTQVASGSVFFGTGACLSTTLAYIQIPSYVVMRAAPTISYTGTPQIYGPSSGVQNLTSFGGVYFGNAGFMAVAANTAGNLTAGQAAALFTNGAVVTFSAEL